MPHVAMATARHGGVHFTYGQYLPMSRRPTGTMVARYKAHVARGWDDNGGGWMPPIQ